jgi:hypothetical protein
MARIAELQLLLGAGTVCSQEKGREQSWSFHSKKKTKRKKKRKRKKQSVVEGMESLRLFSGTEEEGFFPLPMMLLMTVILISVSSNK